MELARHVGQWSKDRTTRIGSVIAGPNNEIRATGYNGFPRGVDDSIGERFERPGKYLWTEHAERNAIYNAARIGVPLEGCRIYIPWFPCIDCARAIVQCGLVEVVAIEPDWSDTHWGEHFRIAREMFRESSLSVTFMENVR
jgi:dCMP deaminase